MGTRRMHNNIPALASRSSPEFCTYCRHRILAGYRVRSVDNIMAELVEVCSRSVSHARIMDEALRDIPGVKFLHVPLDRTRIYYQYCTFVPDRDDLVRRSIQRGIDIETLHMDVCTSLTLFCAARKKAPGAELAAEVVQLPVHASLTEEQVRNLANRIRRILLARTKQPVQS
jgi:dTDP-4-amino-4,6-dideoxygalactose transaminase